MEETWQSEVTLSLRLQKVNFSNIFESFFCDKFVYNIHTNTVPCSISKKGLELINQSNTCKVFSSLYMSVIFLHGRVSGGSLEQFSRCMTLEMMT